MKSLLFTALLIFGPAPDVAPSVPLVARCGPVIQQIAMVEDQDDWDTGVEHIIDTGCGLQIPDPDLLDASPEYVTPETDDVSNEI